MRVGRGTWRKMALGLGILSAAMGSLGLLWPPIPFVALVPTAVCLLMGYRLAGPVVVRAGLDEWLPESDGEGFKFDVPFSRHGSRHPVVQTLTPAGNGVWEEVTCWVGDLSDGTV